MKNSEQTRTLDQVARLLRLSQPFSKLNDEFLRRIAAIVRFVSYQTGISVYEMGTPAMDMYIIVSGKVQHCLSLGAGSKDQISVLKDGDLFGWAGLFKSEPYGHAKRLAKTVCLEEAELIVLNCLELADAVKTDTQAYDLMMSSFVDLIVREFSVPRTWLGFVDLEGKLVRNEVDAASANADKRFLY